MPVAVRICPEKMTREDYEKVAADLGPDEPDGRLYHAAYGTDEVQMFEVWESPEHFDALSRSRGFRPAPYLARAKWVALEQPKVLTPDQLKAYLKRAHAVIAAALPKKKQAELGL